MYYPVVLDHRGNPVIPHHVASAYPYEGATHGRRLGDWGTFTAGPNAAITGSLAALRSRQRQLVRNNPLVHGGVDSIVANMVGTGITPRWQVADSGLKTEIQELWADSVPEMDADGVSSFYGLQAVAAHTMINGGEALGRFVHRSPYEDLIVPLQVQVMEGDHLDESMNEPAPNGNEIRMGIEFDGTNRRSAYWLYKQHPGEFLLNAVADADHTEKIRIPAGDIMHVGRPKRAGQIRFTPWLSSILLKLHEIDQCVDAELVRRKTTTMFGGFIVEQMGMPNSLPGAGGVPPFGTNKGPDANRNLVVELEPGIFPKLPPGLDVKFSQPTDVGGNYLAWMQQQLRDIARGMGITYEQLTGDLTEVNYSSIRAGLLEFRRLIIMIIYQTLVFQFCRPVAIRWLDTAVINGTIRIPDYFENRRKFRRIQWMPQSWDWVDPVKDQIGDMMEVRNGFTTRDRKVAERASVHGCGDGEVLDTEVQGINQRTDDLGLVYDTDPRKTTASGVLQKILELEYAEKEKQRNGG